MSIQIGEIVLVRCSLAFQAGLVRGCPKEQLRPWCDGGIILVVTVLIATVGPVMVSIPIGFGRSSL